MLLAKLPPGTLQRSGILSSLNTENQYGNYFPKTTHENNKKIFWGRGCEGQYRTPPGRDVTAETGPLAAFWHGIISPPPPLIPSDSVNRLYTPGAVYTHVCTHQLHVCTHQLQAIAATRRGALMAADVWLVGPVRGSSNGSFGDAWVSHSSASGTAFHSTASERPYSYTAA